MIFVSLSDFTAFLKIKSLEYQYFTTQYHIYRKGNIK